MTFENVSPVKEVMVADACLCRACSVRARIANVAEPIINSVPLPEVISNNAEPCPIDDSVTSVVIDPVIVAVPDSVASLPIEPLAEVPSGSEKAPDHFSPQEGQDINGLIIQDKANEKVRTTVRGICFCRKKNHADQIICDQARIVPSKYARRLLDNNLIQDEILHVGSGYRKLWSKEKKPQMAKFLLDICTDSDSSTVTNDIPFGDLLLVEKAWKNMIRPLFHNQIDQKFFDMIQSGNDDDRLRALVHCLENKKKKIPATILDTFPLSLFFKDSITRHVMQRFIKQSQRGKEIIRWDKNLCSRMNVRPTFYEEVDKARFASMTLKVLQSIPVDEHVAICGGFPVRLISESKSATQSGYDVDIYVCSPDANVRQVKIQAILNRLQGNYGYNHQPTAFCHLNQFNSVMTVTVPGCTLNFQIIATEGTVKDIFESFDMDYVQIGCDGKGWFSTVNFITAFHHKVIREVYKVVPVRVAKALLKKYKFHKDTVKKVDRYTSEGTENPKLAYLIENVLKDESVKNQLHRYWSAEEDATLERAHTMMKLVYGTGTVFEVIQDGIRLELVPIMVPIRGGVEYRTADDFQKEFDAYVAGTRNRLFVPVRLLPIQKEVHLSGDYLEYALFNVNTRYDMDPNIKLVTLEMCQCDLFPADSESDEVPPNDLRFIPNILKDIQEKVRPFLAKLIPGHTEIIFGDPTSNQCLCVRREQESVLYKEGQKINCVLRVEGVNVLRSGVTGRVSLVLFADNISLA